MTTNRVNGDDRSVIAIDIGGSSTKLALVDARGQVRDWQSFRTAGPDAAVFMGRLVMAALALQASAGDYAVGVSIAVAGFVGADGSLEYNANLPWLERVPIRAMLSDALQLSAIADADSNAACAAEYIFGQGRDSKRFLCLTGGTGMGVGMIAEGRMLRIAHGCLGDAGHVIVAPLGPPCSCGGRGCAEALLSTALLAQRYAEGTGQKESSFRLLVRDAHQGVPQAQALLEETGRWLGITAASLANIFFPDRIAVAGGLSQAGDAFFTAALESFQTHLGSFPLSRASLVRATTGEHATLLGAAAGFFHPEIL